MRGAPTMFSVARVISDAIRDVRRVDGPSLDQGALGFQASFLLAGQIAGRSLRLYQVYAEGNFIEASEDTPFFQIGETKYGKPILDRVMNFGMPLSEAVKVSLISMDSTIRSNMSVGMPLICWFTGGTLPARSTNAASRKRTGITPTFAIAGPTHFALPIRTSRTSIWYRPDG